MRAHVLHKGVILAALVALVAGVAIADTPPAGPDMDRPLVRLVVSDHEGVEQYRIAFATMLMMDRPIGDGRYEGYRVARLERVSEGVTLWADSRSCEAVDEALHRLSQLPYPVVRSPRDPVDMQATVPLQSLHGHVYEISALGLTPRRSMVNMTLSTSTGEVAEWGAWAVASIEACGRPELQS